MGVVVAGIGADGVHAASRVSGMLSRWPADQGPDLPRQHEGRYAHVWLCVRVIRP